MNFANFFHKSNSSIHQLQGNVLECTIEQIRGNKVIVNTGMRASFVCFREELSESSTMIVIAGTFTGRNVVRKQLRRQGRADHGESIRDPSPLARIRLSMSQQGPLAGGRVQPHKGAVSGDRTAPPKRPSFRHAGDPLSYAYVASSELAGRTVTRASLPELTDDMALMQEPATSLKAPGKTLKSGAATLLNACVHDAARVWSFIPFLASKQKPTHPLEIEFRRLERTFRVPAVSGSTHVAANVASTRDTDLTVYAKRRYGVRDDGHYGVDNLPRTGSLAAPTLRAGGPPLKGALRTPPKGLTTQFKQGAFMGWTHGWTSGSSGPSGSGEPGLRERVDPWARLWREVFYFGPDAGLRRKRSLWPSIIDSGAVSGDTHFKSGKKTHFVNAAKSVGLLSSMVEPDSPSGPSHTRSRPRACVIGVEERRSPLTGEFTCSAPKSMEKISKRKLVWTELSKLWRANVRMKGFILNSVNGGFAVAIAGYIAFLPKSLCINKKVFIGQWRQFAIIGMNPKIANIVVKEIRTAPAGGRTFISKARAMRTRRIKDRNSSRLRPQGTFTIRRSE